MVLRRVLKSIPNSYPILHVLTYVSRIRRRLLPVWPLCAYGHQRRMLEICGESRKHNSDLPRYFSCNQYDRFRNISRIIHLSELLSNYKCHHIYLKYSESSRRLGHLCVDQGTASRNHLCPSARRVVKRADTFTPEPLH